MNEEGYERNHLYLRTSKQFIAAAARRRRSRAPKSGEFRALNPYYISRAFHRDESGLGYDLNKPRKFRKLFLCCRCLPKWRLNDDEYLEVDVSDTRIVSHVPATRWETDDDGTISDWFSSDGPCIHFPFEPARHTSV